MRDNVTQKKEQKKTKKMKKKKRKKIRSSLPLPHTGRRPSLAACEHMTCLAGEDNDDDEE